MTGNPSFSVIIPSYNRAEHLRPAIDSLLAQDYALFEILVVDDGSTDNTREVVTSYKDPRVHYIHQENGERGAARNRGIQTAAGSIICFLDSDDVVLPHHLSTAAKFITANESKQVYCFSFTIRHDNRERDVILPANINDALFEGNVLSCNGVMLAREIALANQFSEDRALSALEDWELWLRLSAKMPFASCPEITSVIIQHDDRSVLQTVPEKIEKRFASFYEHIAANKDLMRYDRKKLDRLYSSCETYMALHIAMTGKNKGVAFHHLKKGVDHSASALFTRRFAAIIKHLLS